MKQPRKTRKTRKTRHTKPQHHKAPEIDWSITGAIQPSKVDGHPLRTIRFSLTRPGREPVEFSLTAEDAYDMREDIARAYDAVNGIA